MKKYHCMSNGFKKEIKLHQAIQVRAESNNAKENETLEQTVAGLGFCAKMPNVLQYSSFPAVRSVVLSEVINFLLIVKPTTVLYRAVACR